MIRLLLTFIIFSLFSLSAFSQACTTLGQNPSTAFPICGTTRFVQNTVPACTNADVPVPVCPELEYPAKNPFWYRFTCYQSGTLGFEITPNDLTDDYDWHLFDITNSDPNAVFTDVALQVIGNWSGTPGKTGASSTGALTTQCASDPVTQRVPTFSTMPNIIEGHTYLLLISHFDEDSQSGYSLSFGGGTGVITDPLMPQLKTVDGNCGGDIIRIKLNKKIKCNSIAVNGSDFTVNAAGITIVSATGIGCSQQFDTDSLQLQLSGFLDPGTYNVTVKKGADGNTLLDYCDNPVPEGDVLPVTIYPKAPTPMDDLEPPTCAPAQLKLVFKRNMLCSSIAPNGSDFFVTGPYPVNVSSATGGSCANGLTKEIIVTLSAPVSKAGNFLINLHKGSDGNTLINECGEETLPSSLPFSVKDTVNADFTYTITYGCSTDKVSYSHPAKDGVNYWKWDLDEGQQSTIQNPQASYTVFTEKQVTLVVSNGFCKDTSLQKVPLLNALKANFTVAEDECPNQPIQFTDQSIGQQLTHQWSFGDGGSSSNDNPTHTYASPIQETIYNVRYTITDQWGCQQTVQKPILIYSSCTVVVPSAFTPNGDGRNETIRPLNAPKAEQLEFAIYNRWGQLVFKTQNWKKGWDGTLNGKPQPTSVYVWTLSYIHHDTKQKIQQKGTFVLIR